MSTGAVTAAAASAASPSFHIPVTKTADVLEQNEDIIAAVVENIQLGRWQDGFDHFSVLLQNLVSLGIEYDNYPTNMAIGSQTSTPSETMNHNLTDIIQQLPDAVMRRDVLDDLRRPDQLARPARPFQPPCRECINQNKTSHDCRVVAGHNSPNGLLSLAETRQFLCATEVLAQQDKHVNEQKLRNKNKVKKVYKRWNAMEKYTVMLAIARLGSREISQIVGSVPDRTECQLRSFINKNFTQSQLDDLIRGIIPPPPPKYQPPPSLDTAFAVAAANDLKAQLECSSALRPVSCGQSLSWNDMMRQAAQQWTDEKTRLRAFQEHQRTTGNNSNGNNNNKRGNSNSNSNSTNIKSVLQPVDSFSLSTNRALQEQAVVVTTSELPSSFTTMEQHQQQLQEQRHLHSNLMIDEQDQLVVEQNVQHPRQQQQQDTHALALFEEDDGFDHHRQNLNDSMLLVKPAGGEDDVGELQTDHTFGDETRQFFE